MQSNMAYFPIGSAKWKVYKKDLFLPVLFTWNPIGNGIEMIILSSKGICWGKVVEVWRCSGGSSDKSGWWWWWWHCLWFHRLSWTVAATVHVALTVFGVRVCFLRASPFFSIGPPTSSWLRVHLLSIEGTITHCKFTNAVRLAIKEIVENVLEIEKKKKSISYG